MEAMNGFKKVIIPHIISHQDTLMFYKLMQDFKAGKKIIKEVITTTPVVMGAGHNQMQVVIIPSAYLEWETTEEKAKEFRITQSLRP
jgi:hypothetical protein